MLQPCLATAALLLCVLVPAVSQQKVEEGATLHVYTNLLQIPVLILNGKHQAVPPIEPGKFLLRVGTNPPFHPRVRPEGEDPITLAVLVDGAPDGPRLQQLSEGFAAMARDGLHRQDRIAFYGLDGCKLRRTSELRPPDANIALAAVDTLERIPSYEHHWRGEKCDNPVPLWDALSWVSQSLRDEPGRRVILLITNGVDGGSKLSPDEARLAATRNGVAIFSVSERHKVHQEAWSSRTVSTGTTSTSPLIYITEGTGGMVMEATRNDLGDTLVHFPQLLRERYILEFSRPAGMTAGSHFLMVTVGQPRDFIRPAGTSMPVADPETPDPTVQHGRLGDNQDPADREHDTEAQGQPSPPAPERAVPVTPQTTPARVAAPVRNVPMDPTDITNEARPAAADAARP